MKNYNNIKFNLFGFGFQEGSTQIKYQYNIKTLESGHIGFINVYSDEVTHDTEIMMPKYYPEIGEIRDFVKFVNSTLTRERLLADVLKG